MRHIKMYESWLNEASMSSIPKYLDDATYKEQAEVEDWVNKLSKYGNLANQIKTAMSSYRSRYLPTEAWKAMNSAPGLTTAIVNFKELYQKATVGDVSQSALQKAMQNAFKSGIVDSFWYSKEIVNAGNIIKNGDPAIADSIGASIILSQLSIAITKGLYYYSKNISLKNIEANTGIKTIKDALDSIGAYGTIDSGEGIEAIKDMGKSYFSTIKTETKQGYMTAGTHGRTLPSGTYEKSYLSITEEKITPFVNNLNMDTFLNSLKETPSSNIGNLAYTILFIGTYVGEHSIIGINLANNFMEKGGPSWYDEILA